MKQTHRLRGEKKPSYDEMRGALREHALQTWPLDGSDPDSLAMRRLDLLLDTLDKSLIERSGLVDMSFRIPGTQGNVTDSAKTALKRLHSYHHPDTGAADYLRDMQVLDTQLAKLVPSKSPGIT